MKALIRIAYGVFFLVLASSYFLFCHHCHSLNIDITLAAALLSLALLVSGMVMEYFAVMIFMTIAVLFKLAPTSVIFSGFTSEAFWLTFAGIPMGLAIKKTGLADRIAQLLVKYFKGKYWVLVSGMALFGIILAFLIPSAMGRMMLIVPILMAFAETHGYLPGSKGYTGLLLAGIFSTYIAGFSILTSNLPNVILMGSVSSLYHMNLNYSQYLITHFPILGLFKTLLLMVVIVVLFKDQPRNAMHYSIKKQQVSSAEKRLMLYLVLLLLAWGMESIIHLSLAWSAMIVAVICLLPGVGVLDHRTFMKDINLEPLFFVGGLIGLSAVLNFSGLGMIIGQQLLAALPLAHGSHFSDYYLLSLVSAVLAILTTSPGVPAIATPLASNLSQMAHLTLFAGVMTQVVGFSSFALPFQGPPLLVAMRLGHLKLKSVTLICLIMLVISLIVLLPLNYLWWKLLGLV